MPIYTHDELFPPDLIVIPCGAQKDPHPHTMRARDRYTGSHFRLGLAAADAMAARLGHIPTVSHSTAILSARYGLIRTYLSISNYDLRMDQLAARDVDLMVEGMVTTLNHRQPQRIHALTPNRYTAVLLRAVERMTHPAEVVTYFDGCRGIGDQRAILARLVRGDASHLTAVS